MLDVHVDPDALKNYRESFDPNILPKGVRAWYDHASTEVLDRWFLNRFKCLKSHLFLSGWIDLEEDKQKGLPAETVPILGMDFQPDPHRILFNQFLQNRPGEGFALSDLETLTKKMMILWPRGLFKTSAVVVDIVQTILNYPNVRICFLTGGDQLAKRQLVRVKRVFERPTQTFQYLFPEFCLISALDKRTNKWTDVNAKLGTLHEFTVPCRTNTTFAEPTFAISTAKSVKAGSHFDKIYIDDLVNEQNYKSVKALEKCYQDYLDICPLLEPTGFIIMTGTRYSYGDTYERIQEKAREEEKLLGRTIWRFSIRDCWSHPCVNCNHTDVYHNKDINILQPPCMGVECHCLGFASTGAKGVLFPETRTIDGRSIGHTIGFLEGEKIRLGDEFFANQYENCPIAIGSQTFTDTLIGAQTLFDLKQIPEYLTPGAFTFVVGDLAYVGQEDRDFSVLYACRLFKGQIYVYDCMFGNWDSGAVAENTIKMLRDHRPAVMFYEQFNGWEAYNKIIEAEANKQGIVKVPLQWEKCSRSAGAKIVRIGTIKGMLTSRRLWLYALMGVPKFAVAYDTLVQQLVKWPKLGRHDDFADCLGMVIQVPTGFQVQSTPTDTGLLGWLRKLNQTPVADDDYTDNGCGTGIVC